MEPDRTREAPIRNVVAIWAVKKASEITRSNELAYWAGLVISFGYGSGSR